MKKRLFCALTLVVFITHAQQKQDSIKPTNLDEVVISDSRFMLKKENSGKTVIKITQEELKRNQGKTLSEIINTKSGIELNGSRSNAGQNLSYFIRGGNNRQVLVLIDGMQVSDPSQIANDYDLRLVDVNQIESIEIIKGASSTLYGNGAATAVINITTKKASDKKISAVFSTTVGTNQTSKEDNYKIADFSNALSLSGSNNKLTYFASFLHQNTDGLSAIENGTESDEFNRINLNANFSYEFSKKFTAKFFVNHTKVKSDFDDSFSQLDANFRSDSEQNRLGTSLNYAYNDNGNFTINASTNAIIRKIKSSFPNNFKGQSIVVDAFNKHKFNQNGYTIIGVNIIENKTSFDTEQSATTVDPYINAVWISDFGLNLNVGARLNNHSEYGSHFIYNFNPSYTYKFNENYLKFLTSYSTSFIAPSLFQLYGDGSFTLPNLDLNPEENTTLEAGFEVNLNKKTTFSALFFNRKEENAKGYEIANFTTFQGNYVNTDDEIKVNGFELEFKSILTKKITLNANYTFTEKEDIVALRIPKHKVNMNLNYSIDEKSTIGLNYQYTDDRLDVDFSTFPSQNSNLKSFSLFDLNYQTEIIQNKLRMSVLFSNVFDKKYTEVLGFTTKGRNIKLGATILF